MKKKLFLLLIAICVAVNISAQHFCGTIDADNYERGSCERYKPDDWGDSLLLLTNYIPNNDTFPIITIKINAHIWRKDDGTGNRWLDTEEYRDSLRMIFDYANGIAANNQPYSEIIADAEFIPDTRYRFELDTVYYYNNTYLANKSSNTELNQYVKTNYPERLDNFALHMNICNSCDYSGVSTSIGGEVQSVLFVKCYTGRYSGLYADAQLLIHEIGHNLGLRHPYNSEEIDITEPEFLWDLFGKTQQTWCDEQNANIVCYHDFGWDCQVSDTTNTCTNNIMGGTQSGRHYTVLQCARMHRALRIANIRKHAYGYTNVPLVISREQLWDFTYKSYQDIIVEENTTLTVSCRLEMVSQSRIIIKPGGKLIIDGGTITNAHHEGKWRGIEVWGVDSLHQVAVNGRYLQGCLELKNGAVIENAVCAVRLWNPSDDHSEGGIVRATEATFRNNAKAVQICSYTNYNPATGNELPYDARFENCTFVIDTGYTGEESFSTHIGIEDVRGVDFKGCIFTVDRSVPQVSDTPSAIFAFDAGFSVDRKQVVTGGVVPVPTPDEYFVKGSFSGFETAIQAVNSGSSARTFSVKNSVFTGNKKGIFAKNVGYAVISDNSFFVGADADCSFGLYLEGASNSKVEGNMFSGVDTSESDNYGIVVRNSASYNDISLNTFSGLHTGSVSLGNNFTAMTGLTYTCNTNIGNINDFCIYKDGSSNGIAANQGSLSMPAGNTFSGSGYHIYNTGGHNIKYYCYRNDPQQVPDALKIYNVNVIGTANMNPCLSDDTPGGTMKSDGIADLEEKYDDALSAYNSLQQSESQGLGKSGDYDAQLSQQKAACLDIVGEIVKFHLQQEETDYEGVREWLVKSEDIFADRMTVATFIQEGDYEAAVAHAKQVAGNYGLKGDGLKDHNAYLKLVGLYVDLHRTDRGVSQLTDAEMSMVKNIADNGNGSSQSMAEAVMAGSGDLVIVRPCLTMSLTPGTPSVRGTRQDYVPFPINNAVWSVNDAKYGVFGDTIIDDIQYAKVYRQTSYSPFEFDMNEAEYFCAIRNDVDNRRVYGIYKDTLPVRYDNYEEIDNPTRELLLYDFSVKVGDTVDVVSFECADFLGYIQICRFKRTDVISLSITNKDFIHLYDNDSIIMMENGEQRRRILMRGLDPASTATFWLEGVGSGNGPMNFIIPGHWEGSSRRLLCFSQDDELLFSQNYYEYDDDYDCFSLGWGSDVEENNHSAISIFPNPTDGNLAIKLAEVCHSIEIYDSFGRKMMSQQINETTGQQVIDVDVSSYPSGLYLVVVKGDGERYYKRIVKN